MVYRIALLADWLNALAEGRFASADLAEEGFIHCAERPQVQGVYDRYYRDRGELILLAVEESRLAATIKRENLRGGAELFPHVYGPIPLGAIRAHALLAVSPDGEIAWPDGW